MVTPPLRMENQRAGGRVARKRHVISESCDMAMAVMIPSYMDIASEKRNKRVSNYYLKVLPYGNVLA
jgi:hypothetical protein